MLNVSRRTGSSRLEQRNIPITEQTKRSESTVLPSLTKVNTVLVLQSHVLHSSCDGVETCCKSKDIEFIVCPVLEKDTILNDLLDWGVLDVNDINIWLVELFIEVLDYVSFCVHEEGEILMVREKGLPCSREGRLVPKACGGSTGAKISRFRESVILARVFLDQKSYAALFAFLSLSMSFLISRSA